MNPIRISLRVTALEHHKVTPFKLSVRQVDSNDPTRIVQGIDFNAIRVLPVAVTVGLVPILKSLKFVH